MPVCRVHTHGTFNLMHPLSYFPSLRLLSGVAPPFPISTYSCIYCSAAPQTKQTRHTLHNTPTHPSSENLVLHNYGHFTTTGDVTSPDLYSPLPSQN